MRQRRILEISPVDLCAEKHLILIYTNMIEYQYVGETKAPLLRVIDLKQRLKNGIETTSEELEPTHRIVFFSNLDYKKLLSNTIQSISLELRPETRQLLPFSGTSKFFNSTIQKIFRLAWILIMPIR